MNTQPDIWTRVESQEIADCRVFKVRRDFCRRAKDAAEASFFVVENPDWVNVIALTTDENVVLIEQFRHGAEEIILEIPGGMIEENEDISLAARRELLEETGYAAREMINLGKSLPNPAIQNNTIHHFLAVGCEKTAETNFDEHESVVAKLVALDKIPELIASGAITHSLAVTAFYYLSLHRQKK